MIKITEFWLSIATAMSLWTLFRMQAEKAHSDCFCPDIQLIAWLPRFQ